MMSIHDISHVGRISLSDDRRLDAVPYALRSYSALRDKARKLQAVHLAIETLHFK